MMKAFRFAIGLAALVAAGSANAAVVYSTLGQSEFGSDTLSTGVTYGAPLGDSFSVLSSTTITSVELVLGTAGTIISGAQVLVYLVPDNGFGAPTASGITLSASKVLIGSILDSALPNFGIGAPHGTITPTTVTPGVTTTIAPGRWWIELVGSGDTANGGSGVNSKAFWVFNSNGTIGTNVAGESSSYGDYSFGPGFIASALLDTGYGSYELAVNGTTATAAVPEPTTMLILGSGLAGIGLFRRRVARAA